MPEPKQELIVSRQIISLPQHFSTGPIMGRFLRELRDNKRIMAAKCPSGRFLLPPREVDAISLEEPTEWVEVGPEGVIRDYDVIYYASPDPLTGATREVPYIVVWVLLDGVEGDAPLWHLLETDDPLAVRRGQRVRAEFAEERTGQLFDIKYFVRTEEAA